MVSPEQLPVRIVYKDKKHSSGKVEGGTLVLYISSRLPRAVQEEHIAVLTRRLRAQVARVAALATPAPAAGMDPGAGEPVRVGPGAGEAARVAPGTGDPARVAPGTGEPAGVVSGAGRGPVAGAWGPPSGIRTDEELAAWARELNERYYGFPMGAVRFKAQRSLWGSCSGRTRNIYISDRLRDGPRDLLEYVLIHEICHLKEMNHSPRFWRLVARACPDYWERRARLRRYGLWLAAMGAG
ncbi:MAG: M48 family metallopeptidase [Firmicutes bacterium]|nr:M48 family metallopeptidase [Bacillota bacterium]